MTAAAASLTALAAAREIRIATQRPDGTSRAPIPIWVVRVGDDVFVRSFHGPGGSWYRHVRHYPWARISGTDAPSLAVHLVPAAKTVHPAVDEAYRAKYGRGGYGAAMTTPEVAETTLRLEVADQDRG